MNSIRLVLFLFLVLIAGCGQLSKNSNDKGGKAFGENIDSTKVTAMADMLQAMNGVSKKDFTLAGKVTEVCKSEGCWMRVDENNGKQLYVNTQEKFYLPKDIVGKEVMITGYAYQDTTTVDELRSDAKADGKGQAYIDSINSPLVEVSFIAKGVKIK